MHLNWPLRLLLLAIFAFSQVSAAIATTYDWNPAKRPSISLVEAHGQAVKALGLDEAKQFHLI